MNFKSSAFAGALIAQVMHLAIKLPTYHAAWGWDLAVPKDMSFSCTEGAKVGVDSKPAAFACTVTADAGYTCDVKTTSVWCRDSQSNFTDSVPSSGTNMCKTTGHKPGKVDNDNTSTVYWKPVPKCTKPATPSATSGAPSTGSCSMICLLMIMSSFLAICYTSAL